MNGLVLLFLGLSVYIRSLPATPTPIPGPDDPESAWWGLWPLTYVPVWAFALGVLAVFVLVGWGLYQQFALPKGSSRSRVPHSLLTGIAVSLILAFFLLPVVHTRWGDAYILANGIAWPDPIQRITHSWQAPLDVWLHSQLWLALHEPLGWDTAIPVYRLLSPVAGALYLLVVLQISQADWLAPNWLSFGLLTSAGWMLLFFGYIENYSFAAAGVLAYLWLGLETLRGTRPLWLPALALAVTVGFHPSTLVLTPGLLVLAWNRYRVSGKNHGRLFGAAWLTLLPFLAVAALILLLMELGDHGLASLLSDDAPGGGDKSWLVPLFQTTTRWEHYTMFSWLHLRDFLNEQVLVAPAVLPMLLILLPGYLFRSRRPDQQAKNDGSRSPAGYFLLVSAVGHLLLTWLWNPDYGGQRDWDLFSLAYIPATLLLIWLLPRLFAGIRYLVAAVAPLILLQFLMTAAWVYQNRLPWDWPG